MIAVYRWGTRELVLICARADAHLLIPGSWYGRFVGAPLSPPEATLRELIRADFPVVR